MRMAKSRMHEGRTTVALYSLLLIMKYQNSRGTICFLYYSRSLGIDAFSMTAGPWPGKEGYAEN